MIDMRGGAISWSPSSNVPLLIGSLPHASLIPPPHLISLFSSLSGSSFTWWLFNIFDVSLPAKFWFPWHHRIRIVFCRHICSQRIQIPSALSSWLARTAPATLSSPIHSELLLQLSSAVECPSSRPCSRCLLDLASSKTDSCWKPSWRSTFNANSEL